MPPLPGMNPCGTMKFHVGFNQRPDSMHRRSSPLIGGKSSLFAESELSEAPIDRPEDNRTRLFQTLKYCQYFWMSIYLTTLLHFFRWAFKKGTPITIYQLEERKKEKNFQTSHFQRPHNFQVFSLTLHNSPSLPFVFVVPVRGFPDHFSFLFPDWRLFQRVSKSKLL